jgi:CHAT domain-containing protein
MRLPINPRLVPLLAIPLAAVVLARAAPPTDAQEKRLQERDRLRQEAAKFEAQGKSAEALAAAGQALAISREVYGNEHDETADSLEDLAVLHEDRDDLAAARKAREEALAIRTKLHDDKHWRVRATRLGLAHLARLEAMPLATRGRVAEGRRLMLGAADCRDRRDFDDGADRADRAVAIYKDVLGDGHFLYGQGLSLLALLRQDLGQFEPAERLYDQAAKVLEQALGEPHPALAACLENQGRFYQGRWDFARAERLLLQAADLYGQALGKDDPAYAQCLTDLGALGRARGDRTLAECRYNESLAIYRRAGATARPGYAATLAGLAVLRQDQGDYAGAEQLFGEALQSHERAGRVKGLECVAILRGLGRLHLVLADPARAAKEFRRVVDLQREVLGKSHPDLGRSLLDVAFLYEDQKRDKEALDVYRQVQALYTEIRNTRKKPPAEINFQYVRIAQRQGYHAAEFAYDYARKQKDAAQAAEWRRTTEKQYLQAVDFSKDKWGAAYPVYGRCLFELGNAYLLLGDLDAAEARYKESVGVLRPALGEQHPDYLNAAAGLALAQSLKGDYRPAEPVLRDRVEGSRRRQGLIAAAQSEHQQLVTARALRADLDKYLTLAVRARLSGDEAYQHLLAWKGTVFARQRELRLARAHPELAGLLAELRDVDVGLVTLGLAPPPAAEAAQWKQRVAELTRRKEQLEAERAQRQPAFAREDRLRRLTPAQLRGLLPADTALIDFFEYEPYSPPLRAELPDVEPYLAAFVVRRDAPVALTDLGRSRPVAAALAAWQADWAKVEKGLDDPENPAIELRRRVWAPLEAELKGARTVLVSPDGVLNRLPLAALPGRKETFLLQEVALALVPVPQLLPELLAPEKEPAGGAAGRASLFLAGNIDYGADPGPAPAALAAGPRLPRGNKIVKLACADRIGKAEVKAIQECFLATHRQAVLTVREGDQATEAEVCKLAPGHRYLHFATHGYFAPAEFKSALDPETRSDGPAKPFEPLEDAFADASITGYHPGLLSGLMLTGALSEPGPGQGDGVLTALEVAELDLRGVELAVLSACETGLGKEAGGEGALGLQRAFQMAGARATVAGLWKVHSLATEQLMKDFYRNLWDKKMTKLEALRQAQLTMLGQDPWRAPYYWAPFVLSGDWR